ncbi:hypothetical protein H0R92_07390 [Treponema sp. OMZ 840]
MKRRFFSIWFFSFCTLTVLQSTDVSVRIAKHKNPDCIYPKAELGDCFIHMIKITSPFHGSAPAVELLPNSDFVWEAFEPENGWGRAGKTFRYYEKTVPGTHIFFSVTNKIDDVCYFKTVSAHPCLPDFYTDPEEAEIIERFVFFRFTAYADKGGFFENYLDNFLYALDTHTKLLYSYGMPTKYKKIIGNNYIPLDWMPYETAPNTKDRGLKFYEYDPMGFVSVDYSCEFFKIKTNIHIYDWWYRTITAGETAEEVKNKRFMPLFNPDAEKDWTIRNVRIPVASPYRK